MGSVTCKFVFRKRRRCQINYVPRKEEDCIFKPEQLPWGSHQKRLDAKRLSTNLCKWQSEILDASRANRKLTHNRRPKKRDAESNAQALGLATVEKMARALGIPMYHIFYDGVSGGVGPGNRTPGLSQNRTWLTIKAVNTERMAALGSQVDVSYDFSSLSNLFGRKYGELRF